MLKKNNKYTLPEEYKFAVGYPEGIAEATLSLLWLLEKNSHFLLDCWKITIILKKKMFNQCETD